MTSEEFLKENGYFTYFVKGNSMAPLLKSEKDLFTIVPLNKPLKKYDVVLYRLNDKITVLHRIIKINKDGTYILRGDSCIDLDTDIKLEKIIGVLDSVTRNGKEINIKDFKYKLYVLLMIIYHPFLVLYKRTKKKWKSSRIG